MKCGNCGFENDDGSVDCIVCGTSLIRKEEKIKRNINNQRDIPKKGYKADTADNARKTNTNTKNDTNPSSNNLNDKKFAENHNSNSNAHQSQENTNQNNKFQSSMDDIIGEFDKMVNNIYKDKIDEIFPNFQSTMEDMGDELNKTKDDLNKGMNDFSSQAQSAMDDMEHELNKTKEDVNKKINGFFSTRNIAIICLIVILLTLAGCVYALYLNDVKHYYNENSRYDPEYRYSCDYVEYNQTSYTFDEVYTAHTPLDAKMEMFKESDVNGDGVLKGNEITKMDYKLKHSKYAHTR